MGLHTQLGDSIPFDLKHDIGGGRILGFTPFLLVRFAASLDDWGRTPDIWIAHALGAAFAYPISGASNPPFTNMRQHVRINPPPR